ncbi:MAG: energy-coupling factor transporter ATPase [Anaerovoracaceae bacterium]|jgi:energy-coupling factor transport system ATP-binding protein
MSIQVKNISYIYNEGLPDETKALDDVSFDIEDGEFVGIIGHTGSGKSTLLQHLNGLLRPKEGQIIVGDTDITAEGVSMLDVRRRVGLVFQYPEYQLFEESVERDVAFGPKNLGIPEDEIEDRVREAVELVGLDFDAIRDMSPFDLSGGQKRRVAIAGVIAMRPEVLILDEPTAGLDPQAHREILKMIRKIHEGGTSIIILVSHNMNDIAQFSDRVLVIDGGRIVMNDTPKNIFARGDELAEIGLGLPDVTRIMRKLKDRGMDVPTDIFTVFEAEQALGELLRKTD